MQIDAENNASEDDWNKQQVKDMRLREEEMHQEEMEYERLLKQEEDDRLVSRTARGQRCLEILNIHVPFGVNKFTCIYILNIVIIEFANKLRAK